MSQHDEQLHGTTVTMPEVRDVADLRCLGIRPPVLTAIKSLGRSLWIKHISARDRDRYERSVVDETGKLDLAKVEGARARFVSMCVVKSPAGLEPFATAEQWQALDSDVVAEVNAAAQALNSLRTDDVGEAGKD